PGPVALTRARSTPSSLANRRVAGVAGTGPTRAATAAAPPSESTPPAPPLASDASAPAELGAEPTFAPRESATVRDAGPRPMPAAAVVGAAGTGCASAARAGRRGGGVGGSGGGV